MVQCKMAEALAYVITLLVTVTKLVIEYRRIKPHTLLPCSSPTLEPLTNYFLVSWVSTEEHKAATQSV